MKRMLKRLAAVVLAGTMLILPATASTESVTSPGEVVGLGYSEFCQKGNQRYCIDGRVPLINANFAISRKAFDRGAKLVDEIRINDSDQEVQIIFATGIAVEAPEHSPNVVISDLSLRAKKTLRDGGETILQSGDIYFYGGELEFRVGGFKEELEVGESSSVILSDGDSKVVEWMDSGKVTVDYGNMATGESMVYRGDKVMYHYNAEVPFALQSANSSAYIESLDMGGTIFPVPLRFQLLATSDSYIYQYNKDTGKLTATTLKWDEELGAWTDRLEKGHHYIVSDVKLRGASGVTSGGTTAPDSSIGTTDNPYGNPSTGGSTGNIAVAISAIMAIVCISVISIIMSTIVNVKNNRR